jgi:iron complex transport system substrate-binding protein
MKLYFIRIFVFLLFFGCKNNNKILVKNLAVQEQSIQYAKGFSINKYKGYSVVKVNNPWPKSDNIYTYILKGKNGIIPDSLQNNPIINVPIQSIVVTSTTHIPSLEMLGVTHSLVGFPHLDYISSLAVRQLIEAKKVQELGNNQDLNIERIINLQPSVIIGYGIDNHNPALDNLEKSGLKIILNGDWNEQTPLGKAEWIKLFGVLYDKEQLANSIFKSIEIDYKKTKKLAQKSLKKPTVLSGDIYENSWNMPRGESFGCVFIKDAQAQYLWSETAGTGSLSLSIETVLERAKNADIWITSGQFSSLSEMENTNKHYTQFEAFKHKKVYSFAKNKGKTGGILYYELAPNRPDLVLKDILKMVHPELLPDYKMFFFEQLDN